MKESKGEVTLAQACFRLRCGYVVGRDKVLRGELEGRQDERGRWHVREDSLRAHEEREQPGTRKRAAVA